MKQDRNLKLILLILSIAILTAFSPIAQGIQRFRTIYSEVIVNSKAITTEDLTVTGDLTTDDVTLDSDYALSNSAAGQGWECGLEAVDGTAFVDTGLTTATHVVAVLAEDPTDNEESIVTHIPPTTSSVTINVWKIAVVTPTDTISYTAGDSPVDVVWCAYGDR